MIKITIQEQDGPKGYRINHQGILGTREEPYEDFVDDSSKLKECLNRLLDALEAKTLFQILSDSVCDLYKTDFTFLVAEGKTNSNFVQHLLVHSCRECNGALSSAFLRNIVESQDLIRVLKSQGNKIFPAPGPRPLDSY